MIVRGCRRGVATPSCFTPPTTGVAYPTMSSIDACPKTNDLSQMSNNSEPNDCAFDVLTIGESMLTLYRDNSSEQFGWYVGGAESNVARYCAGLGLRTGWISRLGVGLAGLLVHDAISASGVDTSGVEFSETAPTGLMMKEIPVQNRRVQYYRTGSAASQMSPDSHLVERCLNSRLLHLTGITMALSDGCRDLVNTLLSEPSQCLRSFDLNWRPTLWSSTEAASVLTDAANRADIVFVGTDEAAAVWNITEVSEIRRLLPDPNCIVVKDGERGVYTITAETQHFEPALRGLVVDPMGAGDAFAAGFICGVLTRPHDIRRAQRLGHVTAMSALTSRHDVGRLPDSEAIELMLDTDTEGWRKLVYNQFPHSHP